MPFYYRIPKATERGRRTADRLLELRELMEEGAGQIDLPDYSAPIPARSLDRTLLLASWNLREFDSPAYGRRLDESMHYIAEVVSRFDLVAIQEVRENLQPLDRLRDLLGSHWRFIVTDVTGGVPGNHERLAFFFDSRKVEFSGLAGEVVLPPREDGQPALQLARTPFLVGFRAGWLRFALCTVHIYYGTKTAEDPNRVREIRAIASHLAAEVKEARRNKAEDPRYRSEYENVVLLGDFNVFSSEDATFDALTDNGWVVHNDLLGRRTNVGKDQRSFDQIAFIPDQKNIQPTEHAGVLDYFRAVFRDDDEDFATYRDDIRSMIETTNLGRSPSKRLKPWEDRDASDQRTYYRTYWRTHQISDHRPIWIELKTDFSHEYLDRRKNS